MSRLVYIDTNHTLTAQDLTSTGECDYWIGVLNTRINSILERVNAPGYQQDHKDRSALHYRRKALERVESRRGHLVRVAQANKNVA